MKKLFIFSLFLAVALLLPLSIVNAKDDEDEEDDKVTICHVIPNPDQTITVSESALSSHIAHGDTRGACRPPVDVPEFGMIPGAIAAIASAGSFYLLKRKTK